MTDPVSERSLRERIEAVLSEHDSSESGIGYARWGGDALMRDIRATLDTARDAVPCRGTCEYGEPHYHFDTARDAVPTRSRECWSPDDHRPGCYCRQGGEVLEP